MAKRSGSKPLGTAGVVGLGAAAGLVLAAVLLAPAEGAPQSPDAISPAWGAVAGAVLAYLAVCVRYPWRPCPRCGGGSTDKDAERNYRIKRTCWLCRGERWPRLGTRMLRAFGFDPRA